MSYQLTAKLLVLSLMLILVNSFNYSPKPNKVFRDPQLKKYLDKTRSSYFGFTLNLRQSSLFVGAPRAQSSLESQRKVNETGAIYKCSLTTGQCNPYIFERTGNQNIENNEFTYNSEKKDFQWLGASMDGGTKDTDRLIVCAPRLCADVTREYLMHGVCYYTLNTQEDQPTQIKRIAPLRFKNEQVKESGDQRFFYYMFGEQGISVHWSEINEEILIGAPGLHTWKGSMIRHRNAEEEDIGGISKRDTNSLRIPRQTAIIQKNDVLNPELWDQPNDSYFGYSVSSGIFEGNQSTKVLYVASAPQANEQSGEVYIFDIVPKPFSRFTIKKYRTFHGQQFGEFFGYTLLSEDINGDGWTDLIITAPLYAIDMNYEKGAIYVFINKGNFQFETQLIVSPSDNPGRFGTTVSKLGDINHDGFNDIAIGAPFDENGLVYIYLGSSDGLQMKPSQIIKAPANLAVTDRHMFGHGLSKGVDIDSNEFPDLAIGAPNAEIVYLYRAYPVVKVIASISSVSREIKTDQTKFQIRVCYKVESTSAQSSKHDLTIKIKVDPQVKRVHFPDGKNEMEFNTTASDVNRCTIYDANVKYSSKDIFKPIEMEMHYDLVYKVPDSEVFCDKCAAMDPSTSGISTQKITFSTGCKSEICVADLVLTSADISSKFILGSSRTMSVKYDIVNNGESAYLPQINITSSNQMPFAKIPPTCTEKGHTLICDLNRGQPMYKDGKDTLTVIFDTTNIDGKSMKINAEVFSTGGELDRNNNILVNIIELTELSHVEIIGTNNHGIISLEEKSGFQEFHNKFDIKNLGPSSIQESEIILNIPISYLVPNSNNRINLIDINNLTITGLFRGEQLDIQLYQNNSILIINPSGGESKKQLTTGSIASIESGDKTKNSLVPGENLQGMNYDSSKVGYADMDNNFNENPSPDNIMSRRKRAIEARATEAEYARISQRKLSKSASEELFGTLPVNRTIVFNCKNPEETLCVQAKFRVYNFKADNDDDVRISLTYSVDLKEIDKILIDDKEYFVIITDVNITKIGDEKGETIDVQKSTPPNIISKHQYHTTPIWVYIVSALAGLLVLALITYGMHKMGFFKRAKKEEMESLTRNSQRQADETEDEDE